jgi:methionyl-tRNA formyltransferase
MAHYLLASSRDWHLSAFQRRRPRLPGVWSIVVSPDDLRQQIEVTKPRYVFFAHWSAIVPSDLLKQTECVCFHMTDVPYGRGGSPLQNLILRGHDQTMLSALRMTEQLDAGPVYMKQQLSLSGSAAEIFHRSAELTLQMIEEIARNEPEPVPQVGDGVTFVRRTPEQSLLPLEGDGKRLYDHIRMLDAPGYPHAFAQLGKWRLTFTNARLVGETVEASVRFKTQGDN